MKTKKNLRASRTALSILLAVSHIMIISSATAEDIDIYTGTTSGGEPNILFLLDNTSNWSSNNQGWDSDSSAQLCETRSTVGGITNAASLAACRSLVQEIYYNGASTGNPLRPWDSGYRRNQDNVSLTQGQVQLRSLKLVLNRLVCSGASEALKVRIGLETIGSQTVRSNGDSNGIIRFAIRSLTGTATTDGSSCKAILDMLDDMDVKITDPVYKAPASATYGDAMYEAFKYFGGYTNPTLASNDPPTAGAFGRQQYGPDRFSITNSLDDPLAFTDAASRITYRSPITSASACAKNYLVVVGNDYPNAESSGSPARFGGLSYTPTVLPADASRFADEWAFFLANTDVSPVAGVQQLFTYALNVYKDRPSPEQRRLMMSMATNGGVGLAGYLEVGGDISEMVKGFSDILTSAAAVNSVFTATTLPVSTTTQGSYLNQLFVGMFRPDERLTPRWVGNLKQYKLGIDENGDVMLVDASSPSKPAILRGSGFFDPGAKSFWTNDSVFFAAMPSGTPVSKSDSPDGQIVEKGGVAQGLRTSNLTSTAARRVYTLPSSPSSGATLSATPFKSTNSTVTAAFSTDEINWVRGENNVTSGSGADPAGSFTDASGNVVALGSTGVRVSIHGDVLHSRPVALNYGAGDVVVYYGANDGFLRAVDGRQTGSTAGQELWSFVAPEHYPLLKRLRANSPELYLPATTADGTAATRIGSAEKKSYAMDGPIGVFARYNVGGTIAEAKIYATMRRGGSSVYAFDVTDKSNPTLAWKISPTTAGYSALGQTWSTPRAVIFPSSFSEDPVVLMGGGYDPGEDTNSVSSPAVGNVVYVINGRTGARLAVLPTDYSVPGDVTVVDSKQDGVFDRAYVADVRGNLYRINMTDAAGALRPYADWTITKIAALGGKVFGTPDVVVTRDFVAVMVGTGDREKPLLISTGDNFFVVKDKKIGETERGAALLKSDLVRVASVSNTTFSLAYDAATPTPNGCYIQLSTLGEKVVNSPFTIAGATYFGTNRPTSGSENSCSGSLGEARSYMFPFICGRPTSTKLDGGGLPASPVGGLVSILVAVPDCPECAPREELVPFIIGAGTGGSANEAERPRPPMSPVRTRNFWRIENENR